jgi:hypothetical protein
MRLFDLTNKMECGDKLIFGNIVIEADFVIVPRYRITS